MEDKKGKNQILTMIGKATSFRGTISSEENIQIDGKQEGEITTKGNLIITETGEVHGKVEAENLFIAGFMQGETKIDRKLEVFATGNFQGEAEMAIFIVEEGAGFYGVCRQNKK